jgi:hypothetical protein
VTEVPGPISQFGSQQTPPTGVEVAFSPIPLSAKLTAFSLKVSADEKTIPVAAFWHFFGFAIRGFVSSVRLRYPDRRSSDGERLAVQIEREGVGAGGYTVD